MSKRLDIERQKELEPKRMEYAEEKLGEMGIAAVRVNDGELEFHWNDGVVKLWPYTGWFSGKGVQSGRGIENLIHILKKPKKKKQEKKNKLQRCSCGGNMVKRTNRSTKEPFYGCSKYPRCTNTKPIK